MALLLALAGVNVAAFLAFGWDKYCAVNAMRRLSEESLLALALFGGALGALLGQQTFRHKTRKQPFRALLIAAAALNVIVGLVLTHPDLRELAMRPVVGHDVGGL
jgi:uncharacterized membrane protein YsdA (DUF1294 family)